MRLDFKSYKIIKTKNYIKKESLYFFFNGSSENSSNWIMIEQNLKTVNFGYFKVFNKMTRKIFDKSVYKNTKRIINSIIFLIKPCNKKLFKQILTNHFALILFDILAVKINNKIYQLNQLIKNYSLSYSDIRKLIFQFKITNLRQLK